jgi:uroporphyrinogen-III decarboxylase
MLAPERPWSALSPDERLVRRWTAFVEPGLEFTTPQAGSEYHARATRLKKAILLEGEPDRVPVCALTGLYPASIKGISPYEAMHDYPRAVEVWLSCNRKLQTDALMGPTFAAIPARAFELLDVQMLSWPGHGVSRDAGFQYNEREWMLPDEYELLIDDPTDYLLHVYLPRTVSGLAGFAKLVSPLDMVEIVASPPYLMRWASPEVQASLQKLTAAGEECIAWGGAFYPLLGQLVAEGFPGTIGSMSLAPFDFIGDTLRGTRGILTDMFRQPDAVLEACDRLARVLVKWVTRRATPQSPPLVFIPLHKGADSFMNVEQFKKFYWPSLRKVIVGLVEDGFVPYLFAEGAYNTRLEAISDVPAGRTVWQFDRTDMRRAKQILGGIACIQGNVPLSLLQLGTPAQVRDYCRDLIEAVGPGGGFILDVGAVVDEAEEPNMLAMIQTAKESAVPLGEE